MTGIGTLNLTVNSILHRAIKKTSLVRETTEKRIELYYKGVHEFTKKPASSTLNPRNQLYDKKTIKFKTDIKSVS